MIKEIVKKTITEHKLLENHQHIVLGLSGGPDSVCLFHVLQRLSREENMNLTIHPVHVNHKFRPGAAEEDQKFAEAFSRKLGCTCESFAFDCNAIAAAEKMTGEEAGRKVRYQAFSQKVQKLLEMGIPHHQIRIAVAQNADDQAETILFRILRGVGTDGLAGIGYKRYDEQGTLIIRPLLDARKKDILTYCETNGLQPKIDYTNLEPIYTRNKIRLELIPYLQAEYNPAITDTLIRMGKSAAEDKECLRALAKTAYDDALIGETTTEVYLTGEKLRALPKAICQRVLALAFQKIGLTDDLTYTHFQGLRAIVENEKPSARMDLPKGYYLTKIYDNIKAAKAASSTVRLCMESFTREEYEKHKEELTYPHGAFDQEALAAHFGEDFQSRLVLSKREPGDYLLIKDGKKKIQDYFIDAKVPKDEREQAHLVKIGREVLWVKPLSQKSRYSYGFNVCEGTKNVFCIEIIVEI